MITKEFMAKIEGHGSLKVNWENNTVKLHVHEGERLFEGILVGKTAEEAHWITPRICGICPIAHNLASLAAIEKALGIEISETSKLLRNLMKCGQIIQSHVLHLFFLALPDYIGLDKGTDLAKKDKKSFLRALALKEMADEIAYVIAGRNVHPTTTTIGGFHKIPEKEELKKLLEKIRETKENAEWTAKFFSELKYPELKVDLELVAQKDGKIVSSKTSDVDRKTSDVDIKDYKQNIEEELRDYSTAKFGKFQGREIMVGALARMAHLEAKLPSGSFASKFKLDFNNPFHNNLAQAIEILEFTKQAEEIIEKLLNMDLTPDVSIASTSGVDYKGIGAVEAPRGGLYHEIHLDEKGIITYANIITPTVQNLTSIEKSANVLIEQTQNLENKKREQLLNMLVRAYDPCITCSVH
ncbi:MAG: Ni/Fe hydrogenase subunit alpha [Candidatus Parcubacteria bacterium]|nr:Ni/Fe hydrogenase subunit alpha [Candidatus Parcubacteria bacterium]